MNNRIWWRGRVDAVAGAATESVRLIVDQFTDSKVIVGDGFAWGQYLDREHGSDAHWGLYGTSAAAQTLAVKVRLLESSWQPSADRLVAGALKLLPEDLEHISADLQRKKKKGDFNNVLKVAFVVDALRPDSDWTAAGAEPPVVAQLMQLAVDDAGWSSRLPDDEARHDRDRFFPTAYTTLCLTRYQAFDESALSAGARSWLADRIVKDDARYGTPLNYALVGLALLPQPESRRQQAANEAEALKHCEAKLSEWAVKQRDVVIDRPVFNGFSLGGHTDYVFLHPELLAALFFLRRGCPRAGRRFTLSVLDALTKNIREHQGFTTNNGVMSTVDQLWAVRLLQEFLDINERPNSQYLLLPPWDVRLTVGSPQARITLAVALCIVIVLLFVCFVEDSWLAGAAAGLAGVLGILVAFLLTPTSS
jgi:hypothetical protein